MRTPLVVLSLFVAATTLADTPPPVWKLLKGNYGWDFMKPKASKCAKVTAALVAKMKKYTCEVPDAGTSASGKPAVAECKSKDGNDGYVFFAKVEDCKTERETQLANGE